MIDERFIEDVKRRLKELEKREKEVYDFTRKREILDKKLIELATVLSVNNQEGDLDEPLEHVWDLIEEVNSRN